MPSFKHGKNTDLWLNGFVVSSYFRAAGFGVAVEAEDTTTFKAPWKTSIVGRSSATANLNGLYDPTQTARMEALVGANPGDVLTIAPAGALAIGDRARMISVSTTTYGETSPVGGVVGFNCTVRADGNVGMGQVLHIVAKDTNTTTGAEKDDTAATALGWTAHLHVTLVDAGSWVVKLQDAAVSNTYTDVTGGAFTAATGVTSQRLVSASSSTTLRRYVRYVATRTGGTAGDGITFGLAYSRNR